MGQIPGKYPRKHPQNTKVLPSQTAKPAKDRQFPPRHFAFSSILENRRLEARIRQKCKLLLHLGNSRAFSVDNKLGLSYDFGTGTRPKMASAVPPLPV